MKYKTFRNIALGAGALVAVVVIGTGTQCMRQRAAEQRVADEALAREQLAEDEARRAREAQEAQAAQEAAHEEAARAAAAAREPAGPPGLSPSDVDVLAAFQRPVGEKLKDATAGKAWKVNVYADDKVRWNRAKVDLDRDGKWDESWTVKASGDIEKRVAPKDDERYGAPLRLDRVSGWLSKDGPTSAPAAAAAAPATAPAPTAPAPSTAAARPPAGDGMTESDRALLDLVKQLAPTEKIKDATKGKRFKVNLYSDDGARWNRAKVDLDRDDKWDESWTFKGGRVEKKVAPADDESYGAAQVLRGDHWAAP